MDIKQEEVTTLHDLHVDTKRLIKRLENVTSSRPVSVIMPMLFNEMKGDTLDNIVKHLNTCMYLKEVLIPLAARDEQEYVQVKRFFSKLKIPHLVIWCNGPKITNLLTQLKSQGLDLKQYGGKGRDVWIALGIASIESYGIALHDADVVNYTASIPTKLLYPLLEPELDFKFNKGFYARTDIEKTIMYGRVYRLFIHPILRSLIDALGKEPHFIRFLRSFRYPLSGEFSLTSDLARDLDIPVGWGIEVGVMAEIYRNVAAKRICQTDLGFFEHKHQAVGDSQTGLIKMVGDIFKSLLRVLIEEDHVQISRSFLLSLVVVYNKNAQDFIRKYHADALINGFTYDRHLEETMVEQFSQELLNAGNKYMIKPVGTRMPDWLRTISAKEKIREELLDIVTKDNES